MSHAAYRMGILEMTRQAVTWFITAYIFLASPSTKDGTAMADISVGAVGGSGCFVVDFIVLNPKHGTWEGKQHWICSNKPVGN